MIRKYTLAMLFFVCSLFGFAQNARTTLNLTDRQVSVTSYTDKEVVIGGQTDLHITGTSRTLNNSIIKLNSVDSWVFFDNIRPQQVIDSLLKYIYVNNNTAVLKTNVRVSIYRHGAVVIPQSSSFLPMTVFTDQNFGGQSVSYPLFSFNNSLGTVFNNNIRSFKLKRGYMATVATGADGLGYSRVFIADDADLEVSVLPTILDKSISSIRVLQWEWVSKKGWCGYNPTEYGLVNANWRYDWNVGGATTPLVEYVPERPKLNWPSWSDINAKQYVTHVLGLNEPDHSEQHKDDNGEKVVTVDQALAQWPDMLKTGLRVGSPACTNFSWLYQFMDSCKARNYRVDYVAVHAYWSKAPQNWYNDLKYIHERTGRPIWITEWNNGANWTTEWWPGGNSPTGSATYNASTAAKQLTDIKAILTVLDTAHFIERYSIYNWVQNARAMTLGDTLTLAGKYYADDKPVMAFRRVNEVIPTFIFGNPTLTISTTANKALLTVNDPNAECLSNFILEKKTDNGDFVEFYRSTSPSLRQYSDTIIPSKYEKVRYRVKSILIDGTITDYSNEVGYSSTVGDEDIQYGNLSFANVDWNTVFFKKPFASSVKPVIILGACTNKNGSVLIAPRVKLISSTSRFNLQLSPWVYQNITTIKNEESVPYFILSPGAYNFGGLTAEAGKTVVASTWTDVSFATPFDTVPVVFASQLFSSTVAASTVRVRNITKTGFQARLQKETKVTTLPPSESVSYFAIKQGTGIMNNKRVIVKQTAENAISPTIYTTINIGDSIPNRVIIAQMQTCNDDTTATLRFLTSSAKYFSVIKQRERSTGATYAAKETAGWMLIDTDAIPTGLSSVNKNSISVFPNPVKDVLYLSGNNSNKLKVDIYNLVGILVKTIITNDNKIDVSDLISGSYVVRAGNLGSTRFVKL